MKANFFGKYLLDKDIDKIIKKIYKGFYMPHKFGQLPECTNCTFLMVAVMYVHQYPELEEYIAEYIADHPEELNAQNSSGHTALMLSSMFSYTDSSIGTVELLLKNGADPDIKTTAGNTALMMACHNVTSTSSFETVKLLIDYAANINLYNKVGRTALMALVSYDTSKDNTLLKTRHNERIYATKLLCENQVHINIQNNDNETALIIATEKNKQDSHLDIINILLGNGADIYLEDRQGKTAYGITTDNIYQTLNFKTYSLFKEYDNICRIKKLEEEIKKLIWEKNNDKPLIEF